MVSTASTNALPMNCPWRNKLSPSPRPRRGVHIVKVCPVDNIYLLCYTATCLSSIAGAGYSSPFPSHQGVHTRWFGSPHHEYPTSQIAAETHSSSRYFSKKVSVAVSAELWYMFVLQGGERMKYKLLKDLYDCFYTPPELPAQKQEIDECHQALSEVLGKPERRLVLQIIDAKDRIAEDTSIDSFISGFVLAWKLFMELNYYEDERSVSCRTAMELRARFASKEEEK